jgi:hypothetical protein
MKRVRELVDRRRPVGWRMARWLLDQLGVERADLLALVVAPGIARTRVGGPGGHLLPPDDFGDGVDLPTLDVRSQGYTGDCCQNCGGFRVVRSGTCATCADCGTTSGCS